jgi:cytochrome c5
MMVGGQRHPGVHERWWSGRNTLTGVVLVLIMGLSGCGQGSGSDAASATPAHPGEATYTRYCFSCHAAGIAGAPRAGDAEQWAPRIAKGREALLASTIAGIPPGMPARGLCSSCTDEDLDQAIDYMITLGQDAGPTGE